MNHLNNSDKQFSRPEPIHEDAGMKHYKDWSGLAPAPEESVLPIRLLKVLTIFAAGGTEGQVMNLVRYIDREQFDVSFACLKKWGYFLEELEQKEIPVSEFNINSFFKPGTFMQQLRFASMMRQKRVQIMHSYNFYANVFAIPAARMARVPLVIASIRDRGVYLSQAQQLVQKWVCKMADHILVNAESIRDWLLEDGYEEDKISIIRNGIDLSLYEKASQLKTIRQELGIPETAPLVVMLSRLNPQKGVDDFLKAAAQVSKNHPEARFLVVGEKLHCKDGEFRPDMEYHQTLAALTESLGVSDRIIFTGHRTDVPRLLTETNISVLPSHSEGLSNTLLESMAAGVPVVATRVGGSPELVKEGETGLLVPPMAPEQLAGAINRILDDAALAERFSKAARQRALEYFSMDKMVSDTEVVYRSLLLHAKRGAQYGV